MTAGFDATLDDRVAALGARRGGMVPVTELGEVLGALLRGIEGDHGSGLLRVHGELVHLVDYIRSAKHEIAAIRPEEIAAADIPGANDELDAVVRATEEATGTILDAAETLMGMASGLDPVEGARLEELATRIFEASNFQDITGQRIAKVAATLRAIEERVTDLASATGRAAPLAAGAAPAQSAGRRPDADLLNGPQLPGNANSQDDIDALFASL